MSTASQAQVEEFALSLQQMTARELLEAFRNIRTEYRRMIRDGEEKLDPAQLRRIDDGIAQMEEIVRAGER